MPGTQSESTRSCCFSCSGARSSVRSPRPAPQGCSGPRSPLCVQGCSASIIPPSRSPEQVNAAGAAEGGAETNLNNNKRGKKREKKKERKKKSPKKQPLHRGYPGDRANNWRGEQCILIKPLQETRGGNQVNCTEREQEIKNALCSEDGGSHPPLPRKTRPPGVAVPAWGHAARWLCRGSA